MQQVNIRSMKTFNSITKVHWLIGLCDKKKTKYYPTPNLNLTRAHNTCYTKFKNFKKYTTAALS